MKDRSSSGAPTGRTRLRTALHLGRLALRSAWVRARPPAEVRAWHSLHLAPGLLELVREVVNTFSASEQSYASRAEPWRRTLLFHGPPGVGKTSLVGAAAALLGWPLVRVTAAEAAHDGALQRAILQCRLLAPAVLALEDVDLLAAHPGANAAFLGLLDEKRCPRGLLVLATTASFHRLRVGPGAAARRFDRVIEVTLPGPEQRDAWIRHTFADVASAPLMEELTARTDGLSFNHLRELYFSTTRARPMSRLDVEEALLAMQQQSVLEVREPAWTDLRPEMLSEEAFGFMEVEMTRGGR